MITHNIKKIEDKKINIINSIILISLIINIISYKIIINSNINFDNVLNKIKDYFKDNEDKFTNILEIINNNSASYDFTILKNYIDIWINYNDNILIDENVLTEIIKNISKSNGRYNIYNLFNIPDKIETVNNNIEINPSVALEDDDDDDVKLMRSLGYKSVPIEIEDTLIREMEATNEEASDEEKVKDEVKDEVKYEVEDEVEDTSVGTTTVTSKSNYNQGMKRLEEEEKQKKEEQEKIIQDFIYKASNDIQKKINEYREKKIPINVNKLLQDKMNEINSDDSAIITVKEKKQIFETVMQQLSLQQKGGTAKIKNDKLKLLIKYILSHLVSSKK
jgi:hypothetical protein